MHWWHAAHFALWGRARLLERSLSWYERILPGARATAQAARVRGARWPKMVGPRATKALEIGPFLIWQQPHPIYLAELVYRAHLTGRRWSVPRDRVRVGGVHGVLPCWDSHGASRYVLGTAAHPRQEIIHPARPQPDLRAGILGIRARDGAAVATATGLKREPTWDKVLNGLFAELPMRDGLYVNTESAPTTFTDAAQRRDHPTLLGAYGFVGVEARRS